MKNFCPRCKYDVDMDHSFCFHCGYALHTTTDEKTMEVLPRESSSFVDDARTIASCPSCEARLAHGSHYCNICGAALESLQNPFPRTEKPILLHAPRLQKRNRAEKKLPLLVSSAETSMSREHFPAQDDAPLLSPQSTPFFQRLPLHPELTVWLTSILAAGLLIGMSLLLPLLYPPTDWKPLMASTIWWTPDISVWPMQARCGFMLSLLSASLLNWLGALVAEAHARRVTQGRLRLLVLAILATLPISAFILGFFVILYEVAASSPASPPLLAPTIFSIGTSVLVLLALPRPWVTHLLMRTTQSKGTPTKKSTERELPPL